MFTKMRLLGLLLVGLALLSQGALAHEGRLQVLVSHVILADVTTIIAAGQADVSVLIPTGADPHSFIPSPGDLTQVAEADLVILNGAGYEESLLDAIMNAGESANIVVASACIEILSFGAAMHHDDDHADEHDENGDEDHDEDDDDHHDENGDEDHDEDGDDHHDEDGDDHHDEDGDEDHDEAMADSGCDAYDAELAALVGEETGHAHESRLGRAEDIDCSGAHGNEDDGHAHEAGACDPHVWMDPHNAIYWTLMIRDALSAADPDNAEDYAAAAHAYAEELVALEADFILPLLEDLPLEQRTLVTSHESLAYFAVTFEFEVVTTFVPGMSTMAEPSPREVAALVDRLRAENVPVIFSDTFDPESTVQAIAAEAGIDILGLYSDTLSAGDGPASTYLDYMRYNVSTIVAGLRA